MANCSVRWRSGELEERRQNSGERAEGGGVHAARRLAHQERLVAKLDRQRKQRADGEICVLLRRMAAEAAEQVILGHPELGVLAHLFAQMCRRAVEEMRRSLGEIVGIDPARADQRPIDMVLDHPLEGPGLGARLQAERGVEVETVFGFEMRADEGRIGDGLGLVDDIGKLPLGRSRRLGPLLAIGDAGHLQLDLGFGHKRADLRQPESGAKAVEGNHASSPDLFQSASDASGPLLPPWCQQQQCRPFPSSCRGVRSLRIHAANRPCTNAHIPVNERHASSTIAQRISRVVAWMETSCSSTKDWAATTGRRLPPRPGSLKNVMDKFPSVEVLSRYTHPLLPTCCQHRAGGFR